MNFDNMGEFRRVEQARQSAIKELESLIRAGIELRTSILMPGGSSEAVRLDGYAAADADRYIVAASEAMRALTEVRR